MQLDLKPLEQKLDLRPVKKSLDLKPIEKPSLDLKPIVGLQLQPLKIGGGDSAFSKMSKFGKVLDIIGRPGYAIKSFIAETQRQKTDVINKYAQDRDIKDLTPEEWGQIQTDWGRQGLSPDKLKDRLESAWQGFTGQERYRAEELARNAGMPRVPFLGFAIEVASDPLMYGGYSAITKTLGKVAKPVIGGARKIPGVEKGITLAGEKIAPLAAKLKDLFVNKTGLGKLNTLIDEFLSKRQYLGHKEVNFGIKTRNVIQNIAKKTAHSVDDVERQIVNLIEHPEIVPRGVTTEAKVLANTLKSHLDNMLIEEMRAGLPIRGLGTSRASAVGKLRENLTTLREVKRTSLESSKKALIQELDILSTDKILKAEGKLVSKVESIKQKAFQNNKARINSLVQKTYQIDDQLKIYEKQLRQYKLRDLPTKQIENHIQRLENEYWYYHSDIADRIFDIPELAKGTAYSNRIKEIENILSKVGTEVSVPKGAAIKIHDIEKQLATGLPPEGRRAGKLLKELTNIRARQELGYFPRITTREATEYLKQAQVGGKGVWSTKLANAIRRKTDDYTLEEFNALVAEHGYESLGGRTVEQFFIQKPSVAVAIRGTRSAKAVTSAQFLDEVGKTYGQRIAPTTWEELPGAITKLKPALKGLKFNPEVAKEISRVTTSYFNPQEARGFLRGFDAVQNSWKRWTLAPFPKYHLRNMVGNVWNNYLAGIADPRLYGKAQAVQMYRKYKSASGVKNKFALENLRKFGISTQQADDLILNAEKTGVVGRGWYAADIENSITKEFGKKGLIEKGMAVGSTIENNARLAHFIGKLDKGDDALAAAQSVKKYLFDYGDLTSFEKQVMKRFMPFYTWTRKNVPLQLEQLWQQPQKFAPLAIPLRARKPEDLLKLKYARPDLYERLPVELKRTIDTVTYIPLEGLIPAGDLVKMLRPQELFTELVTPYLRAPIELLMNKSFYFETDIQKYDYETQELLRLDVPAKLKYTLVTVLPQARMLNEINKIVKKQIRKEELTVGEQAFAQSLSSVYKVNLRDLKDRASNTIQKKIEDLKRGKAWAKRYDRTKEAERINATYRKLKIIMQQIRD